MPPSPEPDAVPEGGGLAQGHRLADGSHLRLYLEIAIQVPGLSLSPLAATPMQTADWGLQALVPGHLLSGAPSRVRPLPRSSHGCLPHPARPDSSHDGPESSGGTGPTLIPVVPPAPASFPQTPDLAQVPESGASQSKGLH